jgi:heme oxygenase
MTLRAALRAETRSSHDGLDAMMRTSGWTTRDGYAAFLKVQYAARLPIEQYFAQMSVAAQIPPPQASLIRQDLTDLGEWNERMPAASDAHGPAFRLPENSDPIGAFWAIAGSSLGNRSILKDVRNASGETQWPVTFLSDAGMTNYWSRHRSSFDQIATPETIAAAKLAADAIFTHFQNTVRCSDEASAT